MTNGDGGGRPPEWTADGLRGRVDDDVDDALAGVVGALADADGYGLERVLADDFSVRDRATGRVFRIEWNVVDEGIPVPESGDEVVGRPGTPLDDSRGGAGPDGKIVGEVVDVVVRPKGAGPSTATVDFARTLNPGTEYARTLVGDEVVRNVPLSWLERLP